MLNMWGSTGIKPDEEEIFYDGFLYIISRSDKTHENFTVDAICLCAEYDEPLSLADISEKYPNVCKVIFEDALRGAVYNYGNHATEKNGTAEKWEKVGETLGYA